jgi:hypothetical protein
MSSIQEGLQEGLSRGPFTNAFPEDPSRGEEGKRKALMY